MVQNADQIGVQTWVDDFGDEWLAVFGAKNQMHQDFREGLWHRSFALSGRGMLWGGEFPRALPWADESEPFGLDE